MIGLTSTPSTRPAPKTSAVSRSRPPPGPMTSVVKPTDRLHEVKGEPGELVFQVLHLRQVAVEAQDGGRRGRIDIHEPCLGRAPLYVRLSDQSPCERSYTATRENEFHLLKSTCRRHVLSCRGPRTAPFRAVAGRQAFRWPRATSDAGERPVWSETAWRRRRPALPRAAPRPAPRRG